MNFEGTNSREWKSSLSFPENILFSPILNYSMDSMETYRKFDAYDIFFAASIIAVILTFGFIVLKYGLV